MRVVAEYHRPDGSVETLRTTLGKWKRAVAACEHTYGLEPGSFIVVWWKHQKHWDGRRRKALHSTHCEVGFRLEWIESQHCKGHSSVVPVLVADDSE
jgi:hypothetical protein